MCKKIPEINTYLCHHQTEAGFDPLNPAGARQSYAPYQLPLGQWRTQKIFMGGGLGKDHMVVICIWFALLVTSQFDVISTFPNQRFGEAC